MAREVEVRGVTFERPSKTCRLRDLSVAVPVCASCAFFIASIRGAHLLRRTVHPTGIRLPSPAAHVPVDTGS